MFILANFIYAAAAVLNILITVMIILIFIRALISWVNADPYNAIVQFLYKTTEPLLSAVRKFLPVSVHMGVDISPFIAFFILTFIRLFIVNTLFDLSVRMRI